MRILATGVVALAGTLSAADQTKTFVAYSMKVAQARVEAAIKSGEDFRKRQPDLYYLGGITKPWAVVLDRNHDDWILLGEHDPKSSLLTLDDWVVALRARFLHPDEDPGVTIHPRPCDACLRAGKEKACVHSTKQDVRFFGGIEDTHFGQVCFEADWLMKKIGFGLEKLPIETLKTYYDLSLEQYQKRGVGQSTVCSRFWFYPIVNRVNVLEDVVLLEKLQMGVFTEVMYAEEDGKPVADVDKFEHYPSESFSRSFSENYDVVAQSREELDTLRGLARLAALAKGLKQVASLPRADFYLTTYPAERRATSRETNVLTAGGTHVGFVLRGGVTLMVLPMRLKGSDIRWMPEAVAVARPAGASLTWVFQLAVRGDSIHVTHRGTVDSDTTAALLQQAAFLQAKRHFDGAIECLTKVLDLAPGAVEAWNDRGNAYQALGQYQRAIDDLTRAIELAPTNAVPYNNRGNAFQKVSQGYERGLSDYAEAIRRDPHWAGPYFNRGLARSIKGELDAAIVDLDMAIQLCPTLSDAFAARGDVYRKKGEPQRAIDDYGRSLLLNPRDAVVHNNLGLLYFDLGRPAAAAIDELEKAIAIQPDPERLVTLGEIYRLSDKTEASLQYYHQALAMSPDFPPALSSLAAAHNRLGHPEEATSWARKYLKAAPQGGDVAVWERYLAQEQARR